MAGWLGEWEESGVGAAEGFHQVSQRSGDLPKLLLDRLALLWRQVSQPVGRVAPRNSVEMKVKTVGPLPCDERVMGESHAGDPAKSMPTCPAT